MSSLRMPAHGEVLDIDGSKMTGDVLQRLREAFDSPYNPQSKPVLPDELLYDDLGLPMWNEIIFTPEFYQTHDEIALFDKHGAEVVSRVQSGTIMIDLGAGDTRKVEHLLAAFEKATLPVTYLALDISKASLEHNIDYLWKLHNSSDSVVKVAGLWGTFEDGMRWVQKIEGPRLFLSLGSVLCNDPWLEALRKVKCWSNILRSDDLLLVGMDAHLMPVDEQKIWAAYHSREDLYKEFFANGFAHANALLGEKWFDLNDWDMCAELEIPTRHRFFFRAKYDIQLGTQGRLVKKGEEFDWFDSHKYGQGDVETMFDKAGLIATEVWEAPDSEFRQYLVKLRGSGDKSGDADSAVSGVN